MKKKKKIKNIFKKNLNLFLNEMNKKKFKKNIKKIKFIKKYNESYIMIKISPIVTDKEYDELKKRNI